MGYKFRKFLLIDGSYLLFRALHVEDIYEQKNIDGTRNGGVGQFFKSLSYELKRHSGYYPVTVFDSGLSERRLKLLPSYKDRSARYRSISFKEDIDEFLLSYWNQKEVLIEVIKEFGIPCVCLDSWEGDDLLYIISKMTKDAIIMTDDKDLIQLVSENVKISRPLAYEIITTEKLSEMGYTPELYLTEKCIMGDPSDNIPNVARGLGKVNANRIAKLIHSNPDSYLDILAESKKKVDKDFVSNYNNYLLNRKLIDLKEVDNDLNSDILSIINDEICLVLGKSDYFQATVSLGKYGVRGVDVDSLMLNLASAKKHFNTEGEV